MTAQHPHDENLAQPATDLEGTDPLGPVTLPKRSKIGRRALALVGTTSMAALAVQTLADGCSTFTTVGHEL
ncbi:hypothetical protein Kfla_6528 [Kribbella flavida DSM 17836]|uniref:Uncharacterized protein n=1 Tax=Kribbella flavida (strain DSM 17836 / JCM 10339 / NBRC 14399) TaxID=479435 RepID=D2PYF7_KRIFD|nr:hypothetical protein [Kribbella flavida]ADB35525.1 hypothetical protein Kfla_6528 [Kribbella flavida DSM 17836]